MKKNIYFHIGTPKTGSTSIQQALFDNKDELKNRGFLYPNTGLGMINHFHLANEFRLSKDVKSLYDELLEEFENSGLDNMILSTEDFYVLHDKTFAPKKVLKNIFENYNVKIIAYVRRQDDFLQSSFAQQLKYSKYYSKRAPKKLVSIMEYFDYMQLHDVSNYYHHLSIWAEYFGKGNIIVQPYEKEQMPNGLIHNFFSLLGFDDEEQKSFKIPQKKENSALSNVQTNLLIIFNESDLDNDVKQKIINYFLGRENENDLCLLTYEQRKQVLNKYKESNEKLAKEFLGREDGRLFYKGLEKKDYKTSVKTFDLIFCLDDVSKNVLSSREKRALIPVYRSLYLRFVKNIFNFNK